MRVCVGIPVLVCVCVKHSVLALQCVNLTGPLPPPPPSSSSSSSYIPQKKQLLSVLHLAIQVLQQFLLLDFPALSEEDRTLLSSFLALMSQLLNWHYTQHQTRFRTNSDAVVVSLKPPRPYIPTFLEPSFLYLFFQLLAKVKSSEKDFHHVVQCLTQLSSLSNFTSEEEKERYLVNFVGGILEYVNSRSGRERVREERERERRERAGEERESERGERESERGERESERGESESERGESEREERESKRERRKREREEREV